MIICAGRSGTGCVERKDYAGPAATARALRKLGISAYSALKMEIIGATDIAGFGSFVILAAICFLRSLDVTTICW